MPTEPVAATIAYSDRRGVEMHTNRLSTQPIVTTTAARTTRVVVIMEPSGATCVIVWRGFAPIHVYDLPPDATAKPPPP